MPRSSGRVSDSYDHCVTQDPGELVDLASVNSEFEGATIVEGYPTIPRGERAPDAFLWTGIASAFERAGFKEVVRRSPTRPIVRRTIRTRAK